MSEDLKKPEDMDEFERALTKAMRRVDAPEGFAERVLSRAEESVVAAPTHISKSRYGAPRLLVMPKPGAWISGVGIGIAAALVLGVFAGEQVHVRHQRERAAEQQFETATRITDRALEHTREQLQRAGVPLE